MAHKTLVVSIHDVAPRTVSVVDQMLDRLAAMGISKCSLLVIPDYHYEGRFDKDAAFCDWLRRRVDQGHEAVLHGYYHLRKSAPQEDMMKRFWTKYYTAGEGEFFDLPYIQAEKRLQEGRQIFQNIGLSAQGFIAPAWLLGAEAQKAVKDRGFSYTVRVDGILDLKQNVRHVSRSLVYSVRARWRRMVSLGWNSLLEKLLRNRAVLRMSLHPPDFTFPRIWNHAEACLNRSKTTRQVMTYQSFVDSTRP